MPTTPHTPRPDSPGSAARRATLPVALLTALGLAAASLTATSAQAAPLVTVNLLNVNDFHGRIDANTVRFAGTIEALRTAQGEANTLLLGAGDLVGASLFASASQQDQPTFDVLDALEFDASGVGNHEFDLGWDHLRDKIIGNEDGFRGADFAYLGANVYAAGTTTPVLPEYAAYTLNGVDVAVIGAVTIETPTLVSPGGITALDFGDPVDAVNRVAAEIADDFDVIVAEYHEGAPAGTLEGGTLENQVALGGAFADIVNNTDPAVDAIFTGHTHRAYAWDGPLPGSPGVTRPIVQTGQYGANVGQVVLTVDQATGDTSSYTSAIVPRSLTPDADLVAAYPRVAAVKTIVDKALNDAAAIGNTPVADITADVTTAFTGGSYVDGVYTGGVRDDRSDESTLGGYVANALRDSLADPARGGAEIGIVNPGGLRSDLFVVSTDGVTPNGVVTYAEANAVLPFVNNLWTLTLTGEQLKATLEQQWQPVGAARPYLHLGLSDNVHVVTDPTAPVGSRVTSIVVDGVPVGPTDTYRIGTFSFLATGGDNFVALTGGSDIRDSGLIDRDAWIEYLDANSPVEPDFARQQVNGLGVPSEVQAGQSYAFTLSNLNLRSQGSPLNATVTATLDYTSGTNAPRSLGTFAVTDGTSTVDLTLPSRIGADARVTLVASPSGTTVIIPAVKGDVRAPTTTSAVATGDLSSGGAGAIVATVTGPSTPTGYVRLSERGTFIKRAKLVDGVATIALSAGQLSPGRHVLTATYSANADTLPSSAKVVVVVG